MADISKCAGQDEAGGNICAYRQSCKRFTAPVSEHQSWSNFWQMAGDDCEYFMAIVKHD